MGNVIIECLCSPESWWRIALDIAPIIVAIWIPCRIARQQDKIALYEKRFECYQQFESLKSFWLLAQEIDSFETNTKAEHNPAWNCQQAYFSVHSLLDDRKSQKGMYDYYQQIAHARFCLEMDRKMFLSLKLLIEDGERDKQIDDVQKSLEMFISALFSRDKSDFQNLFEKKKRFIAEYASLLKIEKKFERLLRIQKRNHYVTINFR